MIEKVKYIHLAIVMGTMASCKTNHHTMNNTSIFPKGEKAAQYFTGDAWVQMLTTDMARFDAVSYNVTFAPGSRNYWHSHPGGQLLFCTSGQGYYQEQGQAIRLLKAGDVVEILPDVVHWHGATPHSQFVHLGVTTQASRNAAVWYNAVTDEEYGSFGK